MSSDLEPEVDVEASTSTDQAPESRMDTEEAYIGNDENEDDDDEDVFADDDDDRPFSPEDYFDDDDDEDEVEDEEEERMRAERRRSRQRAGAPVRSGEGPDADGGNNGGMILRPRRRVLAELDDAPLPNAAADASRDSFVRTRQIQRLIGNTGRIESPVYGLPAALRQSNVHQVLVITMSPELFEDPCTKFTSFKTGDMNAKAEQMRKLVAVLSAVVAQAAITNGGTATTSTSAAAIPSSATAAPTSTSTTTGGGGGGRASNSASSASAAAASSRNVPVRHTMARDGGTIPKIHTYVEFLSASRNTSVTSSTLESTSATNTVDMLLDDYQSNDGFNSAAASAVALMPPPPSNNNNAISALDEHMHVFAGLRFFMFLNDASLDLGALIRSALQNRGFAWKSTAPRMSDSDAQRFQDQLPESVEEFFELCGAYYTGTACAGRRHIDMRLVEIENHENISRHNISNPSDILHPTSFFALSLAMSIDTEGVCTEQRNISAYARSNRFVGFPFPSLVTYIPSRTMSNPALFFSVSLLNEFLVRQATINSERLEVFRTHAIADVSLGLTSGFSEVSMSLIEEKRAPFLSAEQQHQRGVLIKKAREAHDINLSLAARMRELAKIPVSSNYHKLWSRSDVLSLQLFQLAIKNWVMHQDLARELIDPLTFDTYRRVRGLKAFWDIWCKGEVPGPHKEMREWFLKLPPHQQLFDASMPISDLSAYGNIKAWLYWCYDKVFDIHSNHQVLYVVHLAAISAQHWNNLTLGFNVQLTSSPGEGKSVVFKVIVIITPPGVCIVISHSTPQAFSVDNDEFADRIIVYHDAPSFLRGDPKAGGRDNLGGTQSRDAAALITAMSERVLTVCEFNSDREKGEPRSNNKTTARFTSLVFVANNDAVQGPVADRMHTDYVANKTVLTRELGMMCSEAFRSLADPALNADITLRMRVMYVLCAIVFKAQEAHVIEETDTFVCDVFRSRIVAEIKKRFASRVSERTMDRWKELCISAAVLAGVYKILLSETAGERWRRDKQTGQARGFDIMSLLYAQRAFVVTEEIAADVFTAMNDEMAPMSALRVANAVCSGFDPEDAARPGTYAHLFVDTNDVVSSDYLAFRWGNNQAARTIDLAMPPIHRLGAKNVEEMVNQKMKAINVYTHPYHTITNTDTGLLAVRPDTSKPKCFKPLAVFWRGKEKPGTARGEGLYLCVHVSAYKTDTNEITEEMVRNIFEYTDTQEGHPIVTSIPQQGIPRSVLESEALRGMNIDEQTRDMLMPHLFRTLHLKRRPGVVITLANKRAEKPGSTDKAYSDIVRRNLEKTSGYKSDPKLAKARENAVYRLTMNAELFATYCHLRRCGVFMDNYNGEDVDRVFSVNTKKYREQHRDMYPESEDLTYDMFITETCKTVCELKMNNNSDDNRCRVKSLEEVIIMSLEGNGSSSSSSNSDLHSLSQSLREMRTRSEASTSAMASSSTRELAISASEGDFDVQNVPFFSRVREIIESRPYRRPVPVEEREREREDSALLLPSISQPTRERIGTKRLMRSRKGKGKGKERLRIRSLDHESSSSGESAEENDNGNDNDDDILNEEEPMLFRAHRSSPYTLSISRNKNKHSR